MKLNNPDFLCPIEFEENRIEVYIIENIKIFSDFIFELKSQINGNSGKWILYEKGKIEDIGKRCEVIIDPFDITVNERKLISELHKMVEKEIQSTEFLLEWNLIYPFLSNKMEQITSSIEYSLNYKENIEIRDFLKFMDLKFEDNAEDFFERMIDYFKLASNVLGTKIFVLVNIKNFLQEEQLHYLYQESMYCKYYILMVEHHISEKYLPEENITIIDKDACVIK